MNPSQICESRWRILSRVWLNYLSLVQAGRLYPYLVVQQRELVIPLHQLAEEHTLLANDGIVLFNLWGMTMS